MDRTIIAPYKAEEKELSDKLYKKLEGLMLLFPPTDEFRRCFSNTMFLKTNNAAFFQVMHYLFRLHDPVEFKKRFYWPISDKRSEACFRSATVDYLKYLSDKHSLNWNIKQYLVIMPGGMKFITFLLDLVGFIIQEQVRQREKQLGAEITQEEISELNLKRMQMQNEFFKEYASDYIAEIDLQISNLNKKTEELKIELLNLTPDCSLNKEFLHELESSNKELFEKKFVRYAQNVESLEKPLNELKLTIEKFQNKATEQRKDKSHTKQALQKITYIMDSTLIEEINSAWHGSADGPTMNSLVTAFVAVQPAMETWLSQVIQNNLTTSNDVTSELQELKSQLAQLETQIVDYQKKYNPSKIKTKDVKVLPSIVMHSPLLLKYVHTPPIKTNIVENLSARLPLQDENTMLDQYDNYLTLTHTRTARKIRREQPREQSFELNSTLNQSKIIDPVQLLRSIYKGSAEKSAKTRKIQAQQRQNLSLLALKYKERQEMICGIEKEPETPVNTMKTFESMKTPKTPFNSSSGEITRIAISMSVEKSPSAMLLKKPSVVKKVQNASLNIQNLSTSPSGRLEALVPVEDTASLAFESTADKLSPNVRTNNDENNANLLNTSIRFKMDLSDLNADAIFNTSDTLLNEVL